MNHDDQREDRFDERPREGLALPAWEDRHRFGWLNGLYLTIKHVLLSPAEFFARMPTHVGLAQPLFFAVVVSLLASFFVWMWSLAGTSLQALFEERVSEAMGAPLLYGLMFMLSPVITIGFVFVSAGLLHLGLMLFGANRLGFEATFRVVAYAQAAGILAVMPFCGSAIGSLYAIAITVVGLYRVHDTDPWRALFAVLLPLLLCLASCGGTLALGIGLGALFR
ncbi:MAG: YIP1 family protein [Candidatus Krumholzibacteriia bacterium]